MRLPRVRSRLCWVMLAFVYPARIRLVFKTIIESCYNAT